MKDKLLQTCKRLIETKAGMGSSEYWTNREFEKLNMLICDDTGVELGPFILKRLWSKAGLVAEPPEFTLNTLARYAGFDSWKTFALQLLSVKAVATEHPSERYYKSPFEFEAKTRWLIAGILVLLLSMVGAYFVW